MDNIKDILSLEYHGEPLSLGRMDSYQVGASIIAFSDFLGVIAKSTYGEKIELRTEIQGIRGDSFDIDFLLTVTAMTVQTTIIGAPIDFKDYFEIIKHAVKAWIHLRGEPPAAISQQGDNYKIENNYGQITYVNGLVVNIISDAKAAKAAEQFIRKPLEAGIEYLSIISPKLKDKTVVEKKDATSFKQIALEKPLIDTEAELGLQIQSPTFKEGNKWQFFDGQNSFYADIQDEDFLNSVSRGKRFGKGDLLIVRLRIKQSSSLGSLNIERIVIKVIKHVEALEQGELLK